MTNPPRPNANRPTPRPDEGRDGQKQHQEYKRKAGAAPPDQWSADQIDRIEKQTGQLPSPTDALASARSGPRLPSKAEHDRGVYFVDAPTFNAEQTKLLQDATGQSTAVIVGAVRQMQERTAKSGQGNNAYQLQYHTCLLQNAVRGGYILNEQECLHYTRGLNWYDNRARFGYMNHWASVTAILRGTERTLGILGMEDAQGQLRSIRGNGPRIGGGRRIWQPGSAPGAAPPPAPTPAPSAAPTSGPRPGQTPPGIQPGPQPQPGHQYTSYRPGQGAPRPSESREGPDQWGDFIENLRELFRELLRALGIDLGDLPGFMQDAAKEGKSKEETLKDLEQKTKKQKREKGTAGGDQPDRKQQPQGGGESDEDRKKKAQPPQGPGQPERPLWDPSEEATDIGGSGPSQQRLRQWMNTTLNPPLTGPGSGETAFPWMPAGHRFRFEDRGRRDRTYGGQIFEISVHDRGGRKVQTVCVYLVPMTQRGDRWRIGHVYSTADVMSLRVPLAGVRPLQPRFTGRPLNDQSLRELMETCFGGAGRGGGVDTAPPPNPAQTPQQSTGPRPPDWDRNRDLFDQDPRYIKQLISELETHNRKLGRLSAPTVIPGMDLNLFRHNLSLWREVRSGARDVLGRGTVAIPATAETTFLIRYNGELIGEYDPSPLYASFVPSALKTLRMHGVLVRPSDWDKRQRVQQLSFVFTQPGEYSIDDQQGNVTILPRVQPFSGSSVPPLSFFRDGPAPGAEHTVPSDDARLPGTLPDSLPQPQGLPDGVSWRDVEEGRWSPEQKRKKAELAPPPEIEEKEKKEVAQKRSLDIPLPPEGQPLTMAWIERTVKDLTSNRTGRMYRLGLSLLRNKKATEQERKLEADLKASEEAVRILENVRALLQQLRTLGTDVSVVRRGRYLDIGDLRKSARNLAQRIEALEKRVRKEAVEKMLRASPPSLNALDPLKAFDPSNEVHRRYLRSTRSNGELVRLRPQLRGLRALEHRLWELGLIGGSEPARTADAAEGDWQVNTLEPWPAHYPQDDRDVWIRIGELYPTDRPQMRARVVQTRMLPTRILYSPPEGIGADIACRFPQDLDRLARECRVFITREAAGTSTLTPTYRIFFAGRGNYTYWLPHFGEYNVDTTDQNLSYHYRFESAPALSRLEGTAGVERVSRDVEHALQPSDRPRVERPPAGRLSERWISGRIGDLEGRISGLLTRIDPEGDPATYDGMFADVNALKRVTYAWSDIRGYMSILGLGTMDLSHLGAARKAALGLATTERGEKEIESVWRTLEARVREMGLPSPGPQQVAKQQPPTPPQQKEKKEVEEKEKVNGETSRKRPEIPLRPEVQHLINQMIESDNSFVDSILCIQLVSIMPRPANERREELRAISRYAASRNAFVQFNGNNFQMVRTLGSAVDNLLVGGLINAELNRRGLTDDARYGSEAEKIENEMRRRAPQLRKVLRQYLEELAERAFPSQASTQSLVNLINELLEPDTHSRYTGMFDAHLHGAPYRVMLDGGQLRIESVRR